MAKVSACNVEFGALTSKGYFLRHTCSYLDTNASHNVQLSETLLACVLKILTSRDQLDHGAPIRVYNLLGRGLSLENACG